MLQALAAAVAVALAFEAAARCVWARRWEQRNYDTAAILSRWPTAGRVVPAVALGLAAHARFDAVGAGAGFAALGWLAVLASTTDLAELRVPKEPCWAGLVLASIAGVASGSPASAASAVTAFLSVFLVVGVLLLVTRGDFGSGDARLMLALSAGAWWAGYEATLLGLAAAACVQVVLRVTIFRRFSGGYPFAPALAAGYLIAVFLLPAAGPCQEWAGAFSC